MKAMRRKYARCDARTGLSIAVAAIARQDRGGCSHTVEAARVGGYFIAASYILATYSQFTRWSMNALR